MKANTSWVNRRRNGAIEDGDNIRYEFILSPCNGFLQNLEPLIKDCELKLRFERTSWNVAVQAVKDSPAELNSIELKDIHAVTEYISSPHWRQYFDKINGAPIMYEYQESEAIIKTLPQNETEIRLDGLKGGNLPSYLFAGIIPQSSLNGDIEHSSTSFKSHGVKEINITLNGNSVNGFPITIKNASPVFPLQKFMDATNRISDIQCGKFLTPNEYKFNWIWAHHFEAEQTSQGWAGINFKLSEPYHSAESMSLVVWIISPAAIKIDKFHQVEKLNL